MSSMNDRSICLSARLMSVFVVRAFQRLPLLVGVALVCLAVNNLALGASINYGDFAGNTVTFIDVTESSLDPLPLYGAPSVSGDSLSFSPQQFLAKSEFQAPPSDTTDGQLSFMVQANGGQAITEISFEEGGALSVTGFAATTDDTYVDVSAIGFVTVLAIDGNSVNPVPIPINLTFDFGVGGNGTWRFASEGSANGILWAGDQILDIKQALIDSGETFSLGATKININLDNILIAQSEPLGTARIDKKLFLQIGTTVPEPSSLILVAFGMVALSVRRQFTSRCS